MGSGRRRRHLSRTYEGRERVAVGVSGGCPRSEDSLGPGLEVGVSPVCLVKATRCGNGRSERWEMGSWR